jgi:hypothetical protein
VQSIGVAALATVLASALSPEVRAMQNRFGDTRPPAEGQARGICEPAATALAWLPETGSAAPEGGLRISALQTDNPLERACRENIAGFERAYQVTFYAAFAALLLGLMLPGWPARWAGRQEAGPPPGH